MKSYEIKEQSFGMLYKYKRKIVLKDNSEDLFLLISIESLCKIGNQKKRQILSKGKN